VSGLGAVVEAPAAIRYARRMPKQRQTFVNDQQVPIYISIEPVPDCFELEPGDRLTLIADRPPTGFTPQVNFINGTELVIWPEADYEVLINDEPAKDRSWKFKHHPGEWA